MAQGQTDIYSWFLKEGKKKNRKRKARRKSRRFYNEHKVATKHPKATLKRLAQGLPLKEIRKTWLLGEYDFRGVGKMKIALRKRESEKIRGLLSLRDE